jgi:hypothetical protein
VSQPVVLPPVTTGVQAGGKPEWDTNHPKTHQNVGNAPSNAGGPGLLSKLKPGKGQDPVKTATSTVGDGPPIVPAGGVTSNDTVPITPGGKNTRFSDTVHSRPSTPTPVLVEDPSGVDDIVHNVPGASGSGTPNKLKKAKPVHDAAVAGPGGTILAPGSGTPAVIHTPAGDSAAGSHPAHSTAHTVPGSAPGTGASVGHAPPMVELEEMILPDGTRAFIRRDPDAKKGKSTEKTKTTTTTTTTGPAQHPVLAESALAHGHCSVCCPSAPKTSHGVPIEPCAHQDGPLGKVGQPVIVAPTAPASASKPASGGGGKKPVPTLIPAGSGTADNLNLSVGETVETEMITPPDGANKLKKKVTTGGGGSAGPTGSPAMTGEQAFDDAKALASECSCGHHHVLGSGLTLSSPESCKGASRRVQLS